MKNPGRMENVTRQLVATLLSLSMVILFASTSLAAINCTQCHGDGSTSSLPIDSVSGTFRNITTGAVKGNHGTHSGAVTIGQPCARCHGAAATTYASNHAILKHYSIQMSASMNYNKGAGVVTAFKQSSNPTLGTCSTVNCHFETITPTWGQTVTWTSQKGASSDASSTCTQCHLGTALASGKHNKHITSYNSDLTSCAKCHPDFYTPAGAPAFSHATSNSGSIKMTFATGSLRTASTFLPGAATNSAATCSTTYCHKGASVTPAWNGAATTCISCHDATSTGLSTVHNIHYNNASPPTAINTTIANTAGGYVYGCANCHPSATHVQGSANPSVQDAQVSGAKISTFTPGGGTATDAKGYSYTTNATCTTVCHTRTGLIAASPIVAANWSGSATGGCAVCHKASGENHAAMVANGANGLSAKHNLHMANDRYGLNTTNYTCAACHAGTATNNTTINGQAGRDLHPNTTADVAMTAFATGGTVTIAGSFGNRTCTNTYCHSNGTIAAGTHGEINWTSGAVAPDCSSCHGGNSTATAANRIKTYAHAQHLYSAARMGKTVGCADCHNASVSSDSAISSYTNHVNKLVNVKFDNVINKETVDATTYISGTATNVAVGATKAPGAIGYTCANLYCHSVGNLSDATGSGTVVAAGGTSFRAVGWNTGALGCDGCHGDQAGKSHPVYTTGAVGSTTANSHAAHVQSSGYSCDFCHNTTTLDTALPPKTLIGTGAHLDRIENVSFKVNGGLTGTYNATVGQKSCSNTYCHGVSASVGWGGTTNCASCHVASVVSVNPTNYWNMSSAHRHHIESAALPNKFLNYSGNISSATNYRFACYVCHGSNVNGTAVHSGGPVNAADQAAQVFFTYTATGKVGTYTKGGAISSEGSFKYTNGTCNNIYCHSDGNGGLAKKTAFNWKSPDNTLRCNGCHGSQDWKLAGAQSAQNYSSIRTQAHARHIRGDINTELNVGNGIDCYRCHGATVSAAMNSYSTVGANVLNKKRHVNKMRDYSGVTPNPNGGAAVSSGQFNQVTHNCSNVYCHSNSKTNNPRIGKFANPDAWNSGVTLRKCNYCHGRQGHGTPVAYDSDANFSRYSSTGVPNYTSGMAGYSTANSHRQHMTAMGTTDYSNTNVCYSCHAATLDSTTGNSANAAKFRAYSSRHTSGAYNVKMKAAYGGSYNGTMGTKTCSTTLCHGGVSPKWGANTTNDSCTKCHGTPSVTVTNTTKYLIAPPFNTSQVSGTATGTGLVSNNPKVGAHQTHLKFSNLFSNYSTQTFMCENCHGGSLPTDTAHIDGSSSPQTKFQRLATNRGTMTPAWTAASLTCSNVYCHNPAGTGGSLNTGNVGTLTFVSWTGTTYLGDTAKTETNCNRCHKSPGAVAGTILLSGTSTHSGVKIADDCSGCHGHNGNNIGPVGRRHVDGIKYGGGGTSCDGCHSYDEGDWAGAAHNFGGQGQGKGAHAKHINHLKTRLGIVLNATTDYSTGYGLGNAGAVCGTCHSNTLGDHSTGDSTAARNINFNASTTYKFGPNNPLYNGIFNTSSATNPKSCSNVSCHYFTSPNWSNY